MKDTLDPQVSDFTNNGKCSNCGNCCTRILPMSIIDILSIESYVEKNKLKENHHPNYYLLNNKQADLTCPFRNWDKGICEIYHLRPEICRRFICNQDPGVIKKNRDSLNGRLPIIDTRERFFNGTNYLSEIDV